MEKVEFDLGPFRTLGSLSLMFSGANLMLRTRSCDAISFMDGFRAFRVSPLGAHLTGGSPKE